MIDRRRCPRVEVVCANGAGYPGPARELEDAGYPNPGGGLIGRGLKGAVYPKPSDWLEEAAGVAGAAGLALH